MTIEETIAQEREMATPCYAPCIYTPCMDKYDCMKCRKRHEQIAEWLEELKLLREEKSEFQIIAKDNYEIGYYKAIDDFVKACKENIMCKTFGLRERNIEQIAEQLKAGEENESSL